MSNYLPEYIIQDIQSLLDRREGVFSCLLSKSWLNAWSTIPTLNFSENTFIGSNPNRMQLHQLRENYVQLVDETMRRYEQHSLVIKNFSLSITAENNNYIVNKWLQIALQSGVKELYLCDSNPIGRSLVVPYAIFSSKTLETVTISEARMEEPDDDMIKCYSLLNLTLTYVRTEEKSVCKFFSNFPMIETIKIFSCDGFKNIQVDNLHHLKSFHICHTNATLKGTFECHSLTDLRLEDVHIDDDVNRNLFLNCPLLETIRFVGCTGGLRKVRAANLCHLKELVVIESDINLRNLESRSLRKFVLGIRDNIDQKALDQLFLKCPFIEELLFISCGNLTDTIKVANLHYLKSFKFSVCNFDEAPSPCIFFYIYSTKCMRFLHLNHLNIDDKSFNESISEFPVLEQLTLCGCNLLEKVKIPCNLLKDFGAEFCNKLIEVNFDTPRLVHLRFCGLMVPKLSFTSCSQLETELTVDVEERIGNSCFIKLRDILMKSQQFTLSLDVWGGAVTEVDVDRLRKLTTPVKNVEKLSLLIPSYPCAYPCAEYLTILDALLSVCHPKDVYLWKFESNRMWFDFYDLLLVEDDDKCWRRELMDAQVVLHEEGDAAKKRYQKELHTMTPIRWRHDHVPIVVSLFRLKWLV